MTDPGLDHGLDLEREPDPVVLGVFRNHLQSLIIRREKGRVPSANPVQQRSLALTKISLIKSLLPLSADCTRLITKVERNYYFTCNLQHNY